MVSPRITTPCVTLITPTRLRPKCFARLETFVRNQDYQGEVQWVVVSDRDLDGYDFTMGQTVIRRACGAAWGGAGELGGDGVVRHSVCLNYLEALPHVRGELVFCLEDDDVYLPGFLSTLVAVLGGVELAGLYPVYYLNFSSRRWTVQVAVPPLAATAFRRSLLPTFASLCDRGDPFMDWGLWKSVEGERVFAPRLYVGCKNVEGGGVGFGHWPGVGTLDPGGLVFRDMLGEYADLFRDLLPDMMPPALHS